MLWLKAFHIIAMVCWFSGLFYLPRLFVYHTQATDVISINRFKLMEHRLLSFITTPAALFTVIFGVAMLLTPVGNFYLKQGWLHTKLTLVLLLLVYHGFCIHYVRALRENRNRRSTRFYRVFNEIPALFLVIIVLLTILKPF